MSTLDKTTFSSPDGLNKDALYQSKDNLTFALNGIRNNHEGGQTLYQSEPGNELTQSIPEGYVFLGHIYGENNIVYIFSTGEDSDEIASFKEGIYTQLVNTDLDFDVDYPITGKYRVRNGCDPVLYWCDGKNEDKWFNVNKPELFQTAGNFDKNKFKFVPEIDIPTIDLVSVNDSGGTLQVGSYYFQVELLDSNENVIYKSDISPQTPIYDDSIASAYGDIDGAVNTPQFEQLAGGVLNTTKSISLQFGNLNTSIKYLRVNVAYQTTANQVIQAHQVGVLIPITNTTIQWTYTGYNPNNGDVPLDYTALFELPITYSSSYVMEQVQNRLVRANLKQTVRDYSSYQAYATQIGCKWVASEHIKNDQTVLGDAKNPRTYWYRTSLQGDEIYLPGIQYLHNDGTWSPVFPISGRVAGGDDTQLLTVVANSVVSPTSTQVWESDVDHLGLSIGDTVPRWKVFNTATITESQTTTHPYSWKGDLGYYEANFNYPDIKDCDNNLIWGVGITTDTKVRFHRMPDRRLIPHMNKDYLIPLGLEFTMGSIYPSTDIVGHRFCIATRNEGNQTVVDSGWLTRPRWLGGVADYIHLTAVELDYDMTETESYARFNSSQTAFNKTLVQSNYFKINNVYQFKSPDLVGGTFPYTSVDLTDPASFDAKLYSIIMPMSYVEQASPLRQNLNIEKSIYINPGQGTDSTVFPLATQSNDWFTNDTVSKITYTIENSEDYISAQSYGLSPDVDEAFINANNYYAYKKLNIQPYTNFLGLQYSYLHLNPEFSIATRSYYGGDVLIVCPQLFRSIVLPVADITVSVDRFAHATWWKDRFEEQKINTALRYGGTDIELQYYKVSVGDLHNILKVARIDTENLGQYYIREEFERVAEYYQLNVDYSLQKNDFAKFALPSNYDYCQTCSGTYKNRIVFSPKSFDEEQFDLYRITNINDYIDIPGHRGRITGVHYFNNQLLVHCEDATFILQPNPQQLQTDQNTAYLGTGDFLSIPPQELLQNSIGYAGCQNKQHQVDTPFGHCWLDQKRGEIFKFNGQLDNLSQKGLSQWLREYLPSELQAKYWQVNHLYYPHLQTTNVELGIGCIMYYDPRFKRLIISKTDYEPIGLVNQSQVGNREDQIYYNPATDQWEVRFTGGTGYEPLSLGNPDHFINTSWTLSYSFEYESQNPWTSWHSYIPYQAYSDSNNFFTLSTWVDPHVTWKHLPKTEYQKFYGTKFDFIIEYQIFDLQTSRFHTLHYLAYAQEWQKGNLKVFKNVDSTFDRLLAYNSNQSTGVSSLVLQNQTTNPYQNLNLGNTTKYVIQTDKNYKIAGLYDLAINTPVVTKSWDEIKLQTGYIDLVSNSSSINTAKTPYQLSELSDKYVTVRLFYKPASDYSLHLVGIATNEFNSIR